MPFYIYGLKPFCILRTLLKRGKKRLKKKQIKLFLIDRSRNIKHVAYRKRYKIRINEKLNRLYRIFSLIDLQNFINLQNLYEDEKLHFKIKFNKITEIYYVRHGAAYIFVTFTRVGTSSIFVCSYIVRQRVEVRLLREKVL